MQETEREREGVCAWVSVCVCIEGLLVSVCAGEIESEREIFLNE